MEDIVYQEYLGEHLKTIREQQIKINNLLNQIGYISAQEHSLLRDFTTASQEAEDFEKVLINTYLAMNFALLGNFEDALVEARRVNRKLLLMKTKGKIVQY